MKRKKLMSLTAVALIAAMALTGCGSSGSSDSTDTGTTDGSAAEAETEEGSTASDADDLNSKTLEEIIAAAQEEGDVESVGMPDSWADWGSLWQSLEDNYGITHTDADMSSAEELSMFQTEGENATKDIGDVGYGFASQAIEEDLVQGYKTSYWDSVPDWAKGEDGKWMVAYTGVTTFLVNTDQVSDVPTSWQDIRDGDYKVALGDLGGGNAQAAFIASAYAFGGDMENLEPAVEFWTELAEAGRINTLDILESNFESGEIAVGIVWSYTALPYSQEITQYNFTTAVPTDGAVQSGYASVINKYAPHANAAALAREIMFSDEGQTYLALAGAIPTREDFEIADEYKDQVIDMSGVDSVIVIDDADAYSTACENAQTVWNENIAPLLVQ